MLAPLLPAVEFTVTFPPSVNVPVPVIDAPVEPISIVTLVGEPRLKVERASVLPAFTVSAPLTVSLAARVIAPPVLLTVTLLNVVVAPPMLCAPVPLKVTVLVLAVKAPLLVQLPATDNELEPLIVSVAPLLMVRLRAVPPDAPIVG